MTQAAISYLRKISVMYMENKDTSKELEFALLLKEVASLPCL